jgi:hypothetical protein
MSTMSSGSGRSLQLTASPGGEPIDAGQIRPAVRAQIMDEACAELRFAQPLPAAVLTRASEDITVPASSAVLLSKVKISC